jgi:superfamily II RNA helicase
MQSQIVHLPVTATSSATPSNKKAQAKVAKKKDAIIARNKQDKLNQRLEEESRRYQGMQQLLNRLATSNPAEYRAQLDGLLSSMVTHEIRLKLLEEKLLYLLPMLEGDESMKIDYFITLSEVTAMKAIVTPFDEQKRFMRPLLSRSNKSREDWYRFQLETISSLLPRRQIDEIDPRVKDFRPDPWQVKFLDAVDRRASVIIVAPTASGELI